MPIIRNSSVRHLANTIKDSGTNPRFALFLGAGASHQSGIITANEMVAFFKGRILDEECPGHENFTEKEKENWFKAQDWYKTDESDYCKCFEHYEPKPINRQRYIERIIEGQDPSFGYLVLANLLAENYINTIITTNFDDLVYSACTSFTGVRPIVHAYGNFASEMRITAQRPRILKLHGDYLYKVLNTRNETELTDPNMEEQVLDILSKYSLIVLGYSGGDKSVMNILSKISEDNDLYWCVMRGKQPSEDVKGLLENTGGFTVEINSFDEMMNEVLRIVKVDVTRMLSLDLFLKSQVQFIEKVKRFRDKYRIDILSEFVEALDQQSQQAADAHQRIKDTSECLKLYTEALEKRRIGHNAEAKELFCSVVDKDPEFKMVRNDLGIIFMDMGNDDVAEKYFSDEIDVNPGGIDAYGNLVLLLRIQGRNDEAREVAEKALRNNAASLQIYTALIALNKDRENIVELDMYEVEARKLLEPGAWYDIATVECVTGNKEAAIANLKREAADKGKKFDRKFAKKDPDFESIRKYKRFKMIVGDQKI